MKLLLCDDCNTECWLRKCTQCTKSKIQHTIEDIVESANVEKSLVKWIVWKKDESASRYIKSLIRRSTEVLIQHFVEIVDKFLIHSYIKRAQSNSFEIDRKGVDVNGIIALLQMDFAENFTCFSQDEIQSAHWNQKLVSK